MSALEIAVLLGGRSAEREISLLSGRAIAEALRSKGHHVDEIDFVTPLEHMAQSAVGDCDVVFVALHGGEGEDGRVQALLELAGKPYVGSGPTACAVSMDKLLTKHILRDLGLATPEWVELTGEEGLEELRAATASLGQEFVLKPCAEGSAIDVFVNPDPSALEEVWTNPQRKPGRWLLERYIPGREITLPMLWGDTTPIIEIRPKDGFYDFRNKYTAGCSEYDCPAEIDAAVVAEVAEQGRQLWRALGLRDFARIDYRLDPDGIAWCLEVNTIPGMTATSLMPMGAKQLGLDFETLCHELCRRALDRAR